jgi:hypothetical protein
MQCTLDRAYAADFGSGGLFWDSCSTLPQPPDIEDLQGTVNPVGFIAPVASTQKAISAEAAYRVYGLGAAADVSPWVDESVLFRRNATSGNQTETARALGLPVDRLRGVDTRGGVNMGKLVGAVPPSKAESALGFSSSDVVDASRTTLRVLAYQHFGQSVGFFWDADPNAYDRRPVRDGHYFEWVLGHVFVHVSDGAVIGANADLDALRTPTLLSDLVDYLTLRKPLPRGIDVIAAFKDPAGGSASIPFCAMRVTRRRDGGPLEPYVPPRSCGCAFEAAPPGDEPPECKACTQDTECPASRPACSFGYCEPT